MGVPSTCEASGKDRRGARRSDGPLAHWTRSAAAAGGAAALADVAGAGGAHLGAAGEAEGRVDGGAGDLLQELGGGVGGLRRGGGDLAGLGAVGVLGVV